MAPRYPPGVVAVGALLVVAGALGEWHVADDAVLGVPVPGVLGILAGAMLLLAGARWTDRLAPRRFAPAAVVVVVGVFSVGAYGYAAVLGADLGGLDEVTAIAPPVAVLLGGGTAVVGGIADWLGVEATVARRRTRAAGLMAAVGLGGIVAMFIWAQVLVLVAGLITGDFALPIDQLLIITSLALGLGVASMAFLYLLVADRDWSFIDLRRPTLLDAGWTVVGIGGLFVALIVVGLVLQLLGAPAAEHSLVEDIRDEGDPEVLIYVLIPAALLIIGPGEELLFRNIVQKSLYDTFSRPAAVVVASLVFAFAHIPAYWAGAGTVTPIIVITILSLILGGIYARTENIIVPAVVHGVYNAVLFALLYLQMTTDLEALSVLLGAW